MNLRPIYLYPETCDTCGKRFEALDAEQTHCSDTCASMAAAGLLFYVPEHHEHHERETTCTLKRAS